MEKGQGEGGRPCRSQAKELVGEWQQALATCCIKYFLCIMGSLTLGQGLCSGQRIKKCCGLPVLVKTASDHAQTLSPGQTGRQQSETCHPPESHKFPFRIVIENQGEAALRLHGPVVPRESSLPSPSLHHTPAAKEGRVGATGRAPGQSLPQCRGSCRKIDKSPRSAGRLRSRSLQARWAPPWELNVVDRLSL